jgi:hypothetical protein
MAILLLFTVTAVFGFVSAFFPRWDLRYGGRGGGSHGKRARVSVEGRIAFGVLFSCLDGAMFVDYYKLAAPSLKYWLTAISLLTLVAMIPIFIRDKRRHNRRIRSGND